MEVLKQSYQRLLAYLNFMVHAKGKKGHGIHSPFVFDLVTSIADLEKIPCPELKVIENIRKQLSTDNRILESFDLGAKPWKKPYRVKDILKKTVSNQAKCTFFFHLTQKIQPKYIIELGTSLGLSTLAFALAQPQAKIITIEGSPQIAEIARENFQKAGFHSIDQRTGSFDTILPLIIPEIKTPFIAFIDGNHSYLPTIQYFKTFAAKIDTNSCIIIDDIHWSKEMEDAWHEICQHTQSTFCLDFFYFGIIFYRRNTLKTHYYLHF
jgi:predicted O-methyltransferase YrrM